MYAAGYAEGYATKARVIEQYWNMMVGLLLFRVCRWFSGTNLFYFEWQDVFYPGQVVPDQDILDFLNKNEAWQKDQVSRFYKDPFWQHVGYIGSGNEKLEIA